MKYMVLILFFTLFLSNAEAQSVDWFETIAANRYNNDAFDVSAFAADDSSVCVGGSAPRAYWAYFVRSSDSLRMGDNYSPYFARNFVVQYSTNGQFRWARPLGGNQGYVIQKMALTTRNGAVYAAAILTHGSYIGLDTINKQNGAAVVARCSN